METHVIFHTRTRLQGDSEVNHVLDCRVSRASEYPGKKCITFTAESDYRKGLARNILQSKIPNFDYQDGEKDKRKFINEVKTEIKSSLFCSINEKWMDHVQALTQQGHFLQLAARRYEDAIFKSYIFDMKKGTMKFLLNTAIDTLSTGANLVRWNKNTSDKCALCKCKETTLHILNGCKVSLEKISLASQQHNQLYFPICVHR